MPNSWKSEVQMNAEPGKWLTTALRFATEQEAKDNARDLAWRWMLVSDYRAAPSDDPVNYRWQDGRLHAVEEDRR